MKKWHRVKKPDVNSAIVFRFLLSTESAIPHIKVFEANQSKGIGEDASFYCQLEEGISQTVIGWYTANGTMINDNRIKVDPKGVLLKLEKISKNDEGQYICMAISSAGNATEAAELIVEGRFDLIFLFYGF